jgi:hypothetical protein
LALLKTNIYRLVCWCIFVISALGRLRQRMLSSSQPELHSETISKANNSNKKSKKPVFIF